MIVLFFLMINLVLFGQTFFKTASRGRLLSNKQVDRFIDRKE